MQGSDLRLLGARAFMMLTLLAPMAAAGQQGPISLSVIEKTGQPAIRVVNRSSAPMTAFLVTVDLTTSHTRLSRLYFDVYAHDYGRSQSIAAASSREMPLPHMVGATLPAPVLRAAIFEDGTTWGDAPWVTELLEMRKILWLRSGEVSAVLRGIAELPLDKSVGSLRWARQFRKEAVAGAPAEKQIMHDWLFSMALKNLDENSRYFNKPAERALVLNHFVKYFDDWRASLGSAKPSIAKWSPASPSAVDLETQLLSDRSRRPRTGLLAAAYYPSWVRRPAFLPTCVTPNPEPVSAGGNDDSRVTATDGICGNQTWELVAEFSGQTFDEGPQEAFGVCTGGFQDCAGFNVPQGKELGRVVMFPATGTSTSMAFGWEVDSWFDINGNCSSCPNPNPQGQTQAQADHQFPTITFHVDCQ
jgi:hypothetical protein